LVPKELAQDSVADPKPMTDRSTVKRGAKRGGEFSRKFRPNIFPASFPSLYRATTVFDTSVFLTAMRLV
jgi:hypothetical protein